MKGTLTIREDENKFFIDVNFLGFIFYFEITKGLKRQKNMLKGIEFTKNYFWILDYKGFLGKFSRKCNTRTMETKKKYIYYETSDENFILIKISRYSYIFAKIDCDFFGKRTIDDIIFTLYIFGDSRVENKIELIRNFQTLNLKIGKFNYHPQIWEIIDILD